MIKITDRMTNIDANIDDLQSGVEAGSRAVGSLEKDAARVDRLLADQLRSADLVGSVTRRTEQVRACLEDQRRALSELRANMMLLRVEMARRRVE